MRPEAKYDFAIAYRVYPKMGREALPLFGGDKFLLTRVAFRSFRESARNFKIKLWLLLDSCPPTYEAFFRANWPAENLEIINYQNKGNGGTFQEQVSLLTAQDEAEICYVAEDDYFYLPDCFERVHKLFLTHPEVEYVTPYDHLEYYVSAHQEMSHEVLPDLQLPIWRTVPSTTCSFFTRCSILRDGSNAFRSYGKPFLFNYGTDATMWLALTKHRIFNPFRFACWLKTTKYVAWSWLTAWMLCGRDILFKPRRRLWAPIPSLAIHLVQPYPPPGIDWDGLIQKAVEDDRRQTTP